MQLTTVSDFHFAINPLHTCPTHNARVLIVELDGSVHEAWVDHRIISWYRAPHRPAHHWIGYKGSTSSHTPLLGWLHIPKVAVYTAEVPE